MNDRTPGRRQGQSISQRTQSAGARQPDEEVYRWEEVYRCLQELSCCGDKAAAKKWFADHAWQQFPGIGTRAITLPPCYQCSEKFEDAAGGCQTKKFQDSDKRGESAHLQVFMAFKLLNDDLERRGDVTMFTMVGVHADNILAWLRQRATEKKMQQVIQKAKTLLQLPQSLMGRRAPDMMVVHQDRIVFVEVKSVGEERPGDEIKNTIKKAIKQLHENQQIFEEVVDNSLISCSVIKVVALPNIQREQVLHLTDPQEGIAYLCKDHLLHFNAEVPEAELDVTSFRTWWQDLPRSHVESQYLQEIVGKYVGLLSTPVRIKGGNKAHLVRHLKDSIREIQHRLQMKILTKEQKEALETFKDTRRVYLKGPGGSGKTLLLITKATEFLISRDHHVIVINMNRGAEGLCIGKYVFEQINAEVKDQNRRTHQICIDIDHYDMERFKEDVRKALPNKIDMKKVLFIADEVHVPIFWSDILETFQNDDFFTEATLWCAGFFSEKPENFGEICLKVVMRCPLAIQHLLHSVDWKEDRRLCYAAGVSWQTEILLIGPLPLCIRHKDHQTGGAVIDCVHCARELARVLKELTPDTVRLPGAGATKSTRPVSAPVGRGQDLCQPFSTSVALLVNIPLKMYRGFDDSRRFQDISEPRYKKYLEKIGRCLFLQELRRNDIKVRLDSKLGSKDLDTLVHQEDILTTWVYNFIGLECGVVIFLPGDVYEPSLPPSPPAVNVESELVASAGIREVRDIPAPGVNTKVDCMSEVAENEETSRGRVDGGDVEEGGDRRLCLPELHWRRDDVARYSDWDKTNMVLAGSRCLSQLILLVP